MKLKLYSVRDELTQDSSIILTAKNDDDLYRQIKLVMCSPDPHNFFNSNPKDKRVIYIGSIETTTGVLSAEPNVILLKGLEEIRLELVDEANAAKSQVIETALKNGLDKDKAQQYLNLLESINFFDLETSKEKSLKLACESYQKQIEKLSTIIERLKGDNNDGKQA